MQKIVAAAKPFIWKTETLPGYEYFAKTFLGVNIAQMI